MKRIQELYECRNCGGLVATTGVACPYCDSTESGTKVVQDLRSGEPVEKTIPWNEPLKLEVGYLAE